MKKKTQLNAEVHVMGRHIRMISKHGGRVNKWNKTVNMDQVHQAETFPADLTESLQYMKNQGYEIQGQVQTPQRTVFDACNGCLHFNVYRGSNEPDDPPSVSCGIDIFDSEHPAVEWDGNECDLKELFE